MDAGGAGEGVSSVLVLEVLIYLTVNTQEQAKRIQVSCRI